MIFPHDALLMGGLTSFLLCVLLVATQRWHGRWSADSMHGVQKFHLSPTCRVAGIAIFGGAIVGLKFSPDDVAPVLKILIVAGIPALAFGFIEDLTKRVGIKARLGATFASGVIACLLTGISLTRVDVIGVDWALTWLPLSIVFTGFAVAGIANSLNILDGFHGLAAGVALVCLSSIGVCAYMAGDSTLAKVCVVVAGVIAGFLVVNFPFGKIFLGDGGAYLIGFWVGWIAVLLPSRNPNVSPWASLLACGYPVTEVLFSMWRRIKRNQHPGHPDRVHLHSLVKTRVVRKQLTLLHPVLKNAAVSPVIWSFATGPAFFAPVFATNTMLLITSFVLCFCLYMMFYRRLIRFSVR